MHKFKRYRVKNLDPEFSGSPRAKSKRWQLIIERDVPNDGYIPKAEALDDDGNDTRTGNQRRKSRKEQLTKMHEGGAVTETKAKEAAKAWMDSENERLSDLESTATVAEYLDGFLGKWERKVEAATMKDYMNTGKRLKRDLGAVPLTDLTGKQINDWIGKMHGEGLSHATQRKSYNLLHLMCKQAVKAGDLEKNPCEMADPPRAPKADPNSLTDKSLEKLLGYMAGMEPTPLHVGARLALTMGLRIGEVCALQWKHVDLETGMLNVRKSIGRGDGKKSTYIKEPKTEGSKRDLPIPAPALGALESRREKMLGELAEADVKLEPDEFGELFVIGSVDGSYQNPNVLTRQWHNLAEAFDLQGTKGRLATFHDLRHTFATKSIAAGVDVRTVASYLGHTNISMTLNTYADADPKAKRALANTIGEVFEIRKLKQ